MLSVPSASRWPHTLTTHPSTPFPSKPGNPASLSPIFYLTFRKYFYIRTIKGHIAEEELVLRLKARDRVAFEYLYDHYTGALYGVILRIVRKEEVAEEVLQDVFLKIWDRFDQYEPGNGKLFTWLLNMREIKPLIKCGHGK